MSTVLDASVSNLNNLTIDDLKSVNLTDIKDVSAEWNYGRRFTLNIKGKSTDPLVFKNIFAKVKEISREERKAGNIENLKIVTSVLEILNQVDETANKTYKDRAEKDGMYRFRTWWHRLGDLFSKSHSIYIEKESKKNLKVTDPMAYKFKEIEESKDIGFQRSDLYKAFINECLVNKNPHYAEAALSKVMIHPDVEVDNLRKILELYFEKGDSASLLAAFRIIGRLSALLYFEPNKFDRVDASMKVLNGLLEKNNDADLLEAATILRHFGWRDVPVEVQKDITSKVVVRLIQMAENGDSSGLDLADKIALYSGNYAGYWQRINELKNS